MLKLISILLFLATSAALIWFFVKSDRGSREPRAALIGAAGFGVLAVGAAIWAEFLFVPSPGRAVTVGGLLFASLGIGLVEEAAKFVPLALFIRKKSYFNEHTDGIVYFAIAGLAFGLIENLVYVLIYTDRLGGSELTGIFRLIVLFFFHAASTAIVGYYLAKAKLHNQSLWRPVIALAVIMIVHGLYDFLFFYAAFSSVNSAYLSADHAAVLIMAMVGGLIISALLNTFMFLYYGRARQWDYSNGLAIDPKKPAMPVPPAPQPATSQ